eukprot:1547421-Alexandrium_andersonii.AAC.1
MAAQAQRRRSLAKKPRSSAVAAGAPWRVTAGRRASQTPASTRQASSTCSTERGPSSSGRWSWTWWSRSR